MATPELIDLIYHNIIDLRRSLDMSFPAKFLRQNEDLRQRTKHAVLEIESARIDLQFYRRSSSVVPSAVINEIRIALTRLLQEPEGITELLRNNRFHSVLSRNRPQPELFDQEQPKDVLGAIDLILHQLDEYDGGLAYRSKNEVAQATILRQIVPGQKLAPVKFNIKSGKIMIVRQKAKALQEDISNIQKARDLLVQRGNSIAASLEQSNCDRRVLEKLQRIAT